jgi:hypothetical protein
LARRFALYPSPHDVTVGVQAIARRGGGVESLVDVLTAALPDLLALGAVPYRRGRLWQAALASHGGQRFADALARALDPDGVLAGGGA